MACRDDLYLNQALVSPANLRPQQAQLRGDVTQLSSAVARTMQQIEQMPNNVNWIRQAAVDRLIERVSAKHGMVMPYCQ